MVATVVLRRMVLVRTRVVALVVVCRGRVLVVVRPRLRVVLVVRRLVRMVVRRVLLVGLVLVVRARVRRCLVVPVGMGSSVVVVVPAVSG